MDTMNHELWHCLYITVYFYLCLCSRVSAGHCNTLLVLSGLGLQHFLAASSLSTLLLPLTQTRRNRHRGRRLMEFRRRSLALCCLRTRTPPHLFFTGVWSRHEPVYQSHFLQGQKMWNSSPPLFRASFWKSLLTLKVRTERTEWLELGYSDLQRKANVGRCWRVRANGSFPASYLPISCSLAWITHIFKLGLRFHLNYTSEVTAHYHADRTVCSPTDRHGKLLRTAHASPGQN